MSQHVNRARDFMEHMLLSCNKVQRDIDGMSEAAFYSNGTIQDAVMLNIALLGAASKRLMDVLPDAATRFPDVQFAAIYAMRNRLIHGYESVMIERVWESAIGEIPPLRAALEAALASWTADLS